MCRARSLSAAPPRSILLIPPRSMRPWPLVPILCDALVSAPLRDGARTAQTQGGRGGGGAAREGTVAPPPPRDSEERGAGPSQGPAVSVRGFVTLDTAHGSGLSCCHSPLSACGLRPPALSPRARRPRVRRPRARPAACAPSPVSPQRPPRAAGFCISHSAFATVTLRRAVVIP